jgi:hypothetical protein
MFARRLATALAAAALLVLGLVPAVLADEPDLSGTVTMPDGSPAANVMVQIGILPGDSGVDDQVWSAQTDEQGHWSATVGAQIGTTYDVSATIVVFASPDESGCLATSGWLGHAQVTVDALPVPPINLQLVDAPKGKVCAATATPHAPTPPATDAGPASGSSGGSGTLPLAGLLFAIALVALGPARRPKRR